MGGQPIKIGPFIGGLNTYSDTTAVGDTEAVEIVNMDVDNDGSLKTRPPIVLEAAVNSGVLRGLGYFTAMTGEKYLLFAGVDHTATYQYFAGVFTTITVTISAAAYVQYANKAWLIAPAGAANPGGSWEPGVGFTAVAAMKKGTAAVIYKERMFIGEGGTGANSSRLYFSAPANMISWSASDFLDVKAGDGQDIVDLTIFADTIVVFKQDSTYIYSYESKPSTGQVRVISTTIGIDGRDCLVEYENSLYIQHDAKALVISNWNYDQLNVKVPFEYLNAVPANLKTPFVVTRVGDRLIYRYFDKYYVYGLKTRTWTTWTTALGDMGRFWEVPFTVSTTAGTKYLVPGQITTKKALYSFVEGYDDVRSEAMAWSVVTKSYDFDSPYTFKKLYWWGLDCIAKSTVSATVFPISYGTSLTWAQAGTRTWLQAGNYTWGRGGDVSIAVNSTTDIQGANSRVFIKFLKALRFRQLNLKISGSLTGAASTSPMRIFGMVVIVDSKQPVVATIT